MMASIEVPNDDEYMMVINGYLNDIGGDQQANAEQGVTRIIFDFYIQLLESDINIAPGDRIKLQDGKTVWNLIFCSLTNNVHLSSQ